MSNHSQTQSSIRWAYALYVCLPLAVAVAIYSLFRIDPPPLLRLFWHRKPIQISSDFDWLVFNLPDGLWAFGFMSFLILVCRNDSKAVRICYYAAGLTLMIALEAVQGRLIPGTFDPMDLIAIVIGVCLSGLLLRRRLRR